jgi:hypothetical protein
MHPPPHMTCMHPPPHMTRIAVREHAPRPLYSDFI